MRIDSLTLIEGSNITNLTVGFDLVLQIEPHDK